MKDKYMKNDEKFYAVSRLLSWIMLLVLFSCCFSYDIWGDEACSIGKSNMAITKLIPTLIDNDVHPPLYFLIVRIGNLFSELLNIPLIYMMKIMSLIPYAVILVWIVPVVRKINVESGGYIAGCFSIFLFGMPQMSDMAITIRMYSWCALFVCGTYVEIYKIIDNYEDNNKNTSWFLVYALSMCAAYSHYFACIAVAILWVLLFFYIHKNIDDLKRYLMWGMVAVLTYTPWLFILLRQTKKVSQGWWVGKIGIMEIKEYGEYIWGNWVFALLFICIFIYPVIKTKKVEWIKICGFVTLIGVVAGGIIISNILRPVFVIRYAFPCIVIMWLGTACMLGEIKQEKLKILILSVAIIIAGYNMAKLVNDEILRMEKAADTYEIMTGLPEDTVLLGGVGDLAMAEAIYGFELYYTPRGAEQPAIDKLADVVFDMKPLENVDNIIEIVEKYENVFFIGYYEYETMMNEFINNGGQIEYSNSIWLNSEKNIYRLDI